MKRTRLIVLLVVGVLLVAGVLIGLGVKRSGAIADLQKEAQTALAYKRADVYFKGTDEDKKYVEGLFNYALEVTKGELNGFFSPPPGKQKFYTKLYQVMVDQAKAQGKGDLSKSLHNWAVGQGYVDVAF
jgi:hypothetical protein